MSNQDEQTKQTVEDVAHMIDRIVIVDCEPIASALRYTGRLLDLAYTGDRIDEIVVEGPDGYVRTIPGAHIKVMVTDVRSEERIRALYAR